MELGSVVAVVALLLRHPSLFYPVTVMYGVGSAKQATALVANLSTEGLTAGHYLICKTSDLQDLETVAAG